jgi:pSer/pThr/pTyr-binding forkhead associated (FHA) protein
VIIADDPTISRAHAEISVGGDGVARVRDLSKFGTKIDGARVDRSLPAGVPLLAAAPGADRDRVRLTFGGKTPVATVAVLVRVDDGDASLATRADSDATTAGEEEEEDDDGGALAAPGRPGDEDAVQSLRRNAARVQPEPRRGGALPSGGVRRVRRAREGGGGSAQSGAGLGGPGGGGGRGGSRGDSRYAEAPALTRRLPRRLPL